MTVSIDQRDYYLILIRVEWARLTPRQKRRIQKTSPLLYQAVKELAS